MLANSCFFAVQDIRLHGSLLYIMSNYLTISGVAVIFCYINQATLFMACIAINENRYEHNIHSATCRPVRSEEECQAEGRSLCYTRCCSGRKPKNRSETESYLDKLPRWLVPRIVLKWPMKIIILLCFAGYLCASIYGITELKEGLELKNLAAEDSYYHKYREWLDNNFRIDTPVSFVIDSELEYSNAENQQLIDTLVKNVKAEATIQDDFEVNWLTDFKSFPGYDNTTEETFIGSLKAFLANPSNFRFENDIVIDETRNVITASRVHVMSESIKDTQEQGKLMLRVRELASESSLSVFAFSSAFIFYEQYVVILSQTLQTVGIAVAMVFFVTTIFMPHPLLLLYVTMTVAMITTGVFGFLYFLDLTLSAITMIHIIMSIGFSVDFAAHICHGYMISDGENRNERMKSGIIRSGAPVFHGAISSLLGVVILAFAKSYIFYSFFQVMSLVITFGILHALFLLPVILSAIGPAISKSESSKNNVIALRDITKNNVVFENSEQGSKANTSVNKHMKIIKDASDNQSCDSSGRTVRIPPPDYD